jgi:hypothetical protein
MPKNTEVDVSVQISACHIDWIQLNQLPSYLSIYLANPSQLSSRHARS